MKPIFHALLLAGLLVVFTPFARAGAREEQRLQTGKITKNEAEHLVLQKFPDATIKSCRLKKENGHSIWQVTFLKANESAPATAHVDGKTGEIVKP
jgi:uncharacterized membrane protein YkoI